MAMTEEQVRILDKVHQINFDLLEALDTIAKRHDIPYFLAYGGLLGAIRHHDFIPWDNDVDVQITRADLDRLIPFLRAELDPEKYEVLMPEDYGEGHYLDMVPRIMYKKAMVNVFPEAYNEYYQYKSCRIVLDFFLLDKFPDTFSANMTLTRLKFIYGLLLGKRYNASRDMSTPWPNGVYRFAAGILRVLGKLCNTRRLMNKTNRLARKYENAPADTRLVVTNDTLSTFKKFFPAEVYAGTTEVPIRDRTFPGPKDPDKALRIMYGDYMELPPEEERIPHVFNLMMSADTFTFEG
ncbi:MAG: LicD family protein [Lachnospiraceae bacterium]|nr:LicD family protein [Lachnospiraceae bacterium]MBQ6542400.1 LicD family protein [Lachnospiraceae bacterium]MBQ7600842.1 LicD family protein [Lachnospiraceae bacterium]MBR6977806.1 LicD family protein [Lachnospiraceae bacterium]